MSVHVDVHPAVPTAESLPRGPLLFLAAWGMLSFGFALSGFMTVERFILIPVFVLTGTAILLLSARFNASVRRLVHELDSGWFLALQSLRLPIGAMFLYELSRGRMHPDFALPAGIGDMAVGALMMALLLFPTLRSPRTLFTANLVGLVDILFVVGSGQRIILFGDPSTMSGFLEAPYPMIPTFIVPLVIGTHVLLFARLRSERSRLTDRSARTPRG